MKAVTVKTVDVSPGVEVNDCFRRECEYRKTFQDRCEDYIKLNMRIGEWEAGEVKDEERG